MVRVRPGGALLVLGGLLLGAVAGGAAGGEEGLAAVVPERYREEVEKSLDLAGENTPEIEGFLRGAPHERREAACFLVAQTAPSDLAVASSGALGEHLEYAFRTRDLLPWSGKVDDDLFLQYVLPAQACSTPLRSTCDSSHAWVEVWCDGVWHYLGACGPADTLDSARFSVPARRTPLVLLRIHGVPEDREGLHRVFPRSALVNSTSVYAETGRVDMSVEPGAEVYFCVFNYGSLRPFSKREADAEGRVRVEFGPGEYPFTVANGGSVSRWRVVEVRPGEEAEVEFGEGPIPEGFWWLRYPKKGKRRSGEGNAPKRERKPPPDGVEVPPDTHRVLHFDPDRFPQAMERVLRCGSGSHHLLRLPGKRRGDLPGLRGGARPGPMDVLSLPAVLRVEDPDDVLVLHLDVLRAAVVPAAPFRYHGRGDRFGESDDGGQGPNMKRLRTLLFLLSLAAASLLSTSTAEEGAWRPISVTVNDVAGPWNWSVNRDISFHYTRFDETLPDGAGLFVNRQIDMAARLPSPPLVTRDSPGIDETPTGANVSMASLPPSARFPGSGGENYRKDGKTAHQRDWDALVAVRDRIFAENGVTGDTPLEEKVRLVAEWAREVNRNGPVYESKHPVDLIFHPSFCVGRANAFAAIMHTMGLHARTVNMNTHSVAEVLLGGRWRFVENRKGRTTDTRATAALMPCSLMEFYARPSTSWVARRRRSRYRPCTRPGTRSGL